MEENDRQNENELTICELKLNIENVSTWGCPGSKCIKQVSLENTGCPNKFGKIFQKYPSKTCWDVP